MPKERIDTAIIAIISSFELKRKKKKRRYEKEVFNKNLTSINDVLPSKKKFTRYSFFESKIAFPVVDFPDIR